MQKSLIALAVLASLGGAAAAQQVTLYGRVDLSLAQQADAVSNKELRNGSASRIGVRGTEDLGGGLKAVFQLEHRFAADTGEQLSSSRFWEGKSIVGLEGAFGRLTFGREENPAYTLSQFPADPWGTDTVAGNGSIINGRIGTTRYSSTINYRLASGGLTFAGQIAEAEGNTPSAAGAVAEDRPYSLGLAYAAGPLTLGLGYENPADADDDWTTLFGGYDFGAARVGLLLGSGTNTDGGKHESWLVTLTAPLGNGQLRVGYGELKNKTLDVVADKQFAVGYHYALSKRTTLYADVVNENRDGLPSDRESTGYDIGIRHNF